MQFKNLLVIQQFISTWRYLILAVLWLTVISCLHFYYNFEKKDREIIKMGYMPVITNLSCPILDYITKEGDGIRFNAIKFSSFAEMGEALRNNHLKLPF